MTIAFLVATPTLFIGVKRSEDVNQFAKSLMEYDQFWERVSAAQLAVEETRSALWRVAAEPEIENQRALSASVDDVHLSISRVLEIRPADFDSEKMAQLEILALHVGNKVEQSRKYFELGQIAEGGKELSLAQLSVTSLVSDTHDIERSVASTVYRRRETAITAMTRTGRDQLVVFLMLIFAIPIFVGFVPIWIVRPLIRLKNIEHRIEEGRIRELAVAGNDEVSQLARAIKDAIMWREELDLRKSTKIFEIRNVLRAVIAHVNEPVVIIDRTGRINYANKPASETLRVETHYLEGSGLSDHFFSTELTKAVAAALSGDINEEGIKARIEFRDGRVVSMDARLSAVHDRAGGVSRVVIVLLPGR